MSIDAIKSEIKSDRLLALPDLYDPWAEYVIMTDASDYAAGAVLMQWQSAEGWPGKREGTGVNGH